jgi:MFS family permease
VPLAPDPHVSSTDVARGQRSLVQDAAWAALAGSLYGGVVMAGFAVALGASPMVIGVLAAIPFFGQVSQIPAIALVERLRQRRRITVYAATASRAVILLLALLPFVEPSRALALLVLAQLAITLLGAIGGCAFNSWIHELVPKDRLGALFSRRLFWSMVAASGGALFAGQAVQRWNGAAPLEGYALAFAAAALAGFVSSWHIARVPEPRMAAPTGPPPPVLAMVRAPFGDANFRRVLVFMASWNFASNLAAPFIAVYLLRQLQLGLAVVTAMWVAATVANALTLYGWGRLSDRLSNKAILAVALPFYFASLMALPFTTIPDEHELTLPLLFLIHLVMGAASGGVGLAIGNLGLKLAPHGQGTAYLSAATLAGALAAGLAAIAGGGLAEWFRSRDLAIFVHWGSPAGQALTTVLEFQHWEFVFALSFLCAGYVLHALSRIEEGPEISERVVVQELVEGLRGALSFPLGWLAERRRRPRG